MNYNSTLYDDISAGCNIISGDEFKEMITTISQLASDTVVKTLGPYGSTTLISDGTGFTYPSKDGWATLNKLRFNDPEYNTLFGLIKQISFNSVNTVGDGTTSAMVGANYFLQAIHEMIKDEPGFRQATFIEIVEEVAKEISDRIRSSNRIKKIQSPKDIHDIAYIATNGNEKFSKIIEAIYTETDNPNIHVTLDSTDEVSYEIQTGYKFDAGTLNFNVYINDENGTCKKNTLTQCVIFDHNVTYNEHKDIIAGLSSLASANNMEIIIMAPYFDDIIMSIINTSVQQMIQRNQVPNIILMQIPITMEAHRKILSDLAILTNTQIFEHGKVRAFNILYHNQTHGKDEQIVDDQMEIDSYKFGSPQEILEACLGSIRSIVIEKSHAFIQDYEQVANPTMLQAIIKEATENYETLKKKANKSLNGHLDKEYMEAHLRYVKLRGKTGVIRVGAVSDLQKRCDKDAIDDAVLACRSAYENGYIRGLNLETLTTISQMYDELCASGEDKNSYKMIALEMLYFAFHQLSLSVLRNKYPEEITRRVTIHVTNETSDDRTVVSFSNEQIISYCIKNDCGYNLVTEEIEGMNNLSVINSVATDLEILKAIVNILSTIMTSNQFVSMNKSYDRKLTHEQALNRQIDDKYRIAKAVTQAVVETIKEDKEFMENFFELVGSNLIDYMSGGELKEGLEEYSPAIIDDEDDDE